MSLEKILKLIDQWKAVLVSLGLLVAAVVGLKQEVLKWSPTSWSWPELLFAFVATALVGLIWLRSRSANASRLNDSDALKLDPKSPEQLVGREEHLDKLLRVLGNPLVFLVSESGCGKSALLRAGVMKGPAFTERFLPIYIDMSVLDWEAGPLRALREGFSRALPPDDRSRLRLGTKSRPKAYANAFGGCYERVGLRPLLLLDQFDDYQAEPQHRERFLPKDTRIWRTAGAIARGNAFWRVLRQCLQSGTLNVVVACREDAAAGLESLRFFPNVPQFDLPRLEPGLVRMIIDRLTVRPPDKPPVILNPEGGWTTLRDRLADDLETRGQLLPQQLKIVLGGLRTLRRLTPAAYGRAGRVAGLEAASVNGAIVAAALAGKVITKDQMLSLLLALVDRTRQPPDKAPPRTANELAAIAQMPDEAAALVLAALEADEIIRRRDSEGGTTAWQLDHAYLAQPILRLERERDQWRRLLEESARSYADATWRRKWRTLLPIRAQIRLLAARFQGQLQYGGHRGYALISLARGLPVMLAVGLVGAAGWAVNEYEAASTIENQLAERDSGDRWDRLTDNVDTGLADLASRSFITRWRVTRDIFSVPSVAEWFAGRAEQVLRALVQLDARRLDSLVHQYVNAKTLLHPDRKIRSAATELARAISLAALSEGTRASLQSAAIETLHGNPSKINVGGAADLVRIAVQGFAMGDTRTLEWLAALREAIGVTFDRQSLNSLAQAYETVAAKLAGGESRLLAELAAVREAVGKHIDSDQQDALRRAYAVVAAKLNDGDARAASEAVALREAIGKATELAQAKTLAENYKAIAVKFKFDDPNAAKEVATLSDAVRQSGDSVQSIAFANAYASAITKLNQGNPHLGDVLATIRQSFGKITTYSLSEFSIETYTAVAQMARSGDPLVANETSALRAAIAKPSGPFELRSAASSFVVISSRFAEPDPAVGDVIVAMREGLGAVISRSLLEQMANTYVALVATLKEGDPRVPAEISALREALKGKRDSDQTRSIMKAYLAVVNKLKNGDARASEEVIAWRQAITNFRFPTSVVSIYDLAGAYAATNLKMKDGDSQIGEVLTKLRQDMSKISPMLLFGVDFGESYAIVAATLKQGDPRVAEELAALRTAIGNSRDIGLINSLARTYVVMAAKLKDGDPRGEDEITALLDAISRTAYSPQLGALGQVYAAVAKIAPRQRSTEQDIAILLGRLRSLRAASECSAFRLAVKSALQKSRPPMRWDKIGLVYTAMLLHSVSAGAPTRELVNDYEELLRERSDAPQLGKGWSGDYWGFTAWAREHLAQAGFDMHEPKVGFLPGTTLSSK